MIDINPIITSTSDSPEEITRALEGAGYEAEPVGDASETTDEKPPVDPSQPPAAGAEGTAPEGGKTDPEPEPGEEDQEEEEQEAAQPPATEQQPGRKRKGGKDRKIDRLTKEKGEVETAKAKLEGEISELRKQVEELKSSHQPKQEAQPEPEPQPEVKPLARPKRPKLQDFEFDQEKYQAALDQYDEDLDAYHEAKREQDAANLRAEIAAQETQREQQRQHQAMLAKATERYPDLETVVLKNESLEVSGPMQDAMKDSEFFYDIGHWLGSHPEQAKQMLEATQLPEKPTNQQILAAIRNAGRYVGMIEREVMAEFGDEPAAPAPPKRRPAAEPAAPATSQPGKSQRQPSAAPAPARPVRAATAPAMQKDPKTMNAVEWREFMATEEGQAYARQMR